MESLNTTDADKLSTSAITTSNEASNVQKTTTNLRLDFLNILTKLGGKKAKFNLYKKSNSSSGVFRGSDRDILHFAVSDFETPTGVLKSAIVRTTDIDSMTISVELEDISDEMKPSISSEGKNHANSS